MRKQRVYVKVVLFIFTVSTTILLYTIFKDLSILNQKLDDITNNQVKSHKNINTNTTEDSVNDLKKSDLKYILQWTSPRNVPFVYMGKGRDGFIERQCPYTNCVVTSDKNYLGDYKKFDVIAFSGPEVIRMPPSLLPKERSPEQKYVFATIESSHYYPVCSNKLDGFFNWTWTFRLDSESKWGYICVRDANNKIVGPKKIMNWIKLEDMDPVSPELKEQLKTKTKAAAWFVSNCYSRSGREKFAKDLDIELKKYNFSVDIYGKCGKYKCKRDSVECDEMLKKDYYFYLSFENSFSEDYVTEKMLYGLQNSAIPIVFGGGNYTRFMPDGIYLNGRDLGVVELAKKMNELINDPDSYAEYFRWRSHYSFHRRALSIETDDYCGMCRLLNDEEMLRKRSVYENFRDWWDVPKNC